MRIALFAFGSRGDVQPMLALALGLQQRGHQVVLGTSQSYQGWIDGRGVGFRKVGNDVEAFMRGAGEIASSQVAFMRKFLAFVRDDIAVSFPETLAAADGAELIVATIHVAASSVAEKLGVPCRALLYTPQVLPSAEHPPLAVPWLGLPGWLNRLLWWNTDLSFNLVDRSGVNAGRRALGLPPIRSVMPLFRTERPIVASAPELGALPADGRIPGAVQTDALILESGEPLSPELERFLAAGPAPVYIGFGSMSDLDPKGTTRLLVEAVQAAGVRAVLGSGWAGLGGEGLPEGMLAIGATNHGLLFPRCAAVVHHGGAGTTHAALRAGVPQLVVAHSADQFYWGRAVERAGVGPGYLARGGLRAKALAGALRAATAGPAGERARALGGQARQRDGVGLTVATLLEQRATREQGPAETAV